MLSKISVTKLYLLSMLFLNLSSYAMFKPAIKQFKPSRLTRAAQLLSIQSKAQFHGSSMVRNCDNSCNPCKECKITTDKFKTAEARRDGFWNGIIVGTFGTFIYCAYKV